MKTKGRTPLIEDVEGNAKLMWITEKRTDRVLFYIHGGAYVMPVNPIMLGFSALVQEENLKRGNTDDFGVVAVTYSLHPERFPAQLTDITLGLTHLISSGVKQENIVLIGDSAGGNLIAQLLAHTLHPIKYPKPLGGACLLSPWLSMDTPTPSHKTNNSFDVVSSAWLLKCGRLYVEGVPKNHIPYIKPNTCGPEEHWFADLDKYVSRVLITGGDKEVLFDDATELYDGMKKGPNSSLDVELVVDEDGIHEDPIFESMVPKKVGGISKTTVKVINWVAECFKH
ncbi:Alpha/Beta hydrolase protein [Rhodocollybia butyracea]|uniref:Alpha/Beta hydrolase protein n=1 Tax=Rhodocollybia butyracea TaxID=206335 RepID=A0A9P5Q445_9AGAR|nr:Alpha/Beta hydrolase protein [Rhodocollybia butyracea]